MPLNLPNLLTWLRILMIPLLVGVYYTPQDWIADHKKNLVAMIVFSLAAITDWLDGYLARTLNQTSPFGAFLDPVADKLMVATALILLVWLGRVEGYIAAIIIGREIAISALREWMAQLGRSKSVAVSFLGKVKTFSQMAAIILLLFHDRILASNFRDYYFELNAHVIGNFLIYVAAILTLWSMAYYLKMAWPELVREE
ncbi:MAG TPA: CDP-diacylglycerol--glycerol-3-phosphate 3-phosphatidyltransferase [Burkholderiales bacterium]|nr:CDP-diacylglycerol--glycerol-3-phosphate 3-phosphatidyltransferase [Burkholderiales bacterium]